MNDIRINRLVIPHEKPVNIQLHGFCNASEYAYGACLYLRSTDQQHNISSRLLCSKSRVAPVKRVTLPRLELCGAVLLAKLVKKTVPILGIPIHSIYLFTDSTIVLVWMKAASTGWKTFVANRVSQIQELTNTECWKHAPTHDNPADLISRRVQPSKPSTLLQVQLWWQGPRWLEDKTEFWQADLPGRVPEDIPEERSARTLLATSSDSDDVMLKFSSYSKLIRVTAYCRRFIQNCRQGCERLSKPLSLAECQEASLSCIRIAQLASYHHEITTLCQHKVLSKKSTIFKLNPFVDEKGILIVGGRLDNSELNFETKHQIILSPHHHFTKLLILYEHNRPLHAGIQLVLASLRAKYWIPRARQTIRSILYKCLPCFRLTANSTHQLMGQLPRNRVTATRPFLTTGVDFAGPISMKKGSTRSKTLQKCYSAIFVCFATKATHIELVTNLTSQAFIAALRRFIAQHGHVRDMYSDNGTTFIGASRKLREFSNPLQDQQFKRELQGHSATCSLRWHFIPPRSPHFGGLWEWSVKAMKYHLRRVMEESVLTCEELTTLLTQTEACLNSRPLCALSDDPNDHTILTPGHFLIGAPLMSPPDPDVTELSLNRISRWQLIQRIRQHWWSRWSKDYLHTLQQRRKWASTRPNLQPCTLVILKEENQPPMQWKVGVIEEVFPGKDNVVRVASVRCSSTTLKRAVHKLVPLPPS